MEKHIKSVNNDETQVDSLYTYFRGDVEFVTPSKSYASAQTDRDYYMEKTKGVETKWMKAPVLENINIKVVDKIRVS